MAWQGHIRALLYPVIFSPDPCAEIDRVVRTLRPEHAPDHLRAIEAALKSGEELHSLLPQPHPEAAVRKYLAELAAAISAKFSGPAGAI